MLKDYFQPTADLECNLIAIVKDGKGVFAECVVLGSDIGAFLENVCYPEFCAGTHLCDIFEAFTCICQQKLGTIGCDQQTFFAVLGHVKI